MKKQVQGFRPETSAKLPDLETDQNKLSEINSPSIAYLDSLVDINRDDIQKFKVYAGYTCVDRIAQLDYNIIIRDIFDSIANGDQKSTLINFREIEILQSKNEIESKQNESKLDDEALASLGKKKKMMVFDGTIKEIGEIMGKYYFGAKNLKGDHLFKSQCVMLAQSFCDNYVTANLERFNYKSILKSLGEGRLLALKEEKTAK